MYRGDYLEGEPQRVETIPDPEAPESFIASPKYVGYRTTSAFSFPLFLRGY